MTTTTCQKCGTDSAEKLCWLCEIENDGGYIYIRTDATGRIILWDTIGEGFRMKIEAKDFCDLVRLQYPRGAK